MAQDPDRKGSFQVKSMSVFEYPAPDFRLALGQVESSMTADPRATQNLQEQIQGQDALSSATQHLERHLHLLGSSSHFMKGCGVLGVAPACLCRGTACAWRAE